MSEVLGPFDGDNRYLSNFYDFNDKIGEMISFNGTI